MEQKFGKNSIDIEALREFCEREGKMVEYRKGEQLEREGDPARWFGFVTEGCFKYVTHGISDDEERDYMAYSCALTFAYADATTLRIQGYYVKAPDGWINFHRGEAEPSF